MIDCGGLNDNGIWWRGRGFDSEGGRDAENSGVKKPIDLGRMSIVPCVVRVVTGFGEEEGMRRSSA